MVDELILIGVFVAGIIVGGITSNRIEHNKAGYQECISELPRNQDCKLIAVPIEETQ